MASKIKEMLTIAIESESPLAWRELMRALPRFQQKLIVIICEHQTVNVETIAKYAFSTSQSVSSTLKKLKQNCDRNTSEKSLSQTLLNNSYVDNFDGNIIF